MSITCQKWRLNNLYRIVDRNSNSIPFKLNAVQEDVLENDLGLVVAVGSYGAIIIASDMVGS